MIFTNFIEKSIYKISILWYNILKNIFQEDDEVAKFEISGSVFKKYKGNDKEVEIPEGVTEIAEGAFLGCKKLTKIKLPEGLTEIGDVAFKDCHQLTELTIPDGVTKIGAGAFNFCTRLADITLPDSVTEIGEIAFMGCDRLASIILPDNLTEISESLFDGCSGLASIAIPESVKKIGGSAFDSTPWLENNLAENTFLIINGILVGTAYLEGNVTLPDDVTAIGEDAFENCDESVVITFRGKNYSYEDLDELRETLN